MTLVEILIIAIVEAMDCFAVAISTGLSKKGIRYSRVLTLSVSFGFFQGGMTLLGYFLGQFAEQFFESVASPIACAILCVLGIRMIYGAVFDKQEEECEKKIDLSLPAILLLSVATSIDAFAVGISLAFINADMILATSAISLASFLMGLAGFEIGKRAAKRFRTKVPEITAGTILIAIGIKLLF